MATKKPKISEKDARMMYEVIAMSIQLHTNAGHTPAMTTLTSPLVDESVEGAPSAFIVICETCHPELVGKLQKMLPESEGH